MQPSPMAETSKLLFPNFRFCIIGSFLLLPCSAVILFVADLFLPVNHFAVECLLNRNVRHGRRRRSAMPMLLARRKPNHVAGTDFFNRATLAPRSLATGC